MLVLYPSGDFAEVWCYVIRHTDGSVSISRGDSHSVAIGKWQLEGNDVRITSQVVFRDVLITDVTTGKAVPEVEKTFQLKATRHAGYWHLAGNGKGYAPLPNFKDLEFLAAFVQERNVPPSKLMLHP